VSSLGASLHELAAAQKASRGVSLYSRFVNRPVGRVLAASAHVLGLTPNQVTVVSAVATATGAALLVLVPPSLVNSVMVWFFLALGFCLDSADGQLARLRGGGSLAGEWLDHVVDAGKVVGVHLAVLVMLYRFGHVSDTQLLVPLAFALVSTLIFAGGTLAPLVRRGAEVGAGGATPVRRPSSTIGAIGLLPADYGVLCLVFLLTWHQSLFFLTYSVLLVVNAVLMCLLLAKWFRELSTT
jgi:phosphatidylglycerophosphate synthase